ncbi:unnamed protein product [Didymodactylos carnosus]|uniref:F-box domain-containing protein n=1 Tax=Didymodactylos carnosus TaxID=1234261 RepID=A0A815G7E2_9BILA|nr:unnamed protein product [Didymodactylos carnosus]CAF1334986.1 unnamed protein product [Didymodactylos carnosus]CAF3787346.1 unnamed protein product [Didymodactylos carnosus]CAF4191404.1 unnamed protein product [Didymodactylos carnosus]
MCTRFTDLTVDLLYEVFNYLSAVDILSAFYGHISPSFDTAVLKIRKFTFDLTQIKTSSDIQLYCEYISSSLQHRIVSLQLSGENDQLNLFTRYFQSSQNCAIRTVSLTNVSQPNDVHVIIPNNLSKLSELTTLSIQFKRTKYDENSEVLALIVTRLPHLKSLILHNLTVNYTIDLPENNNNHIESLIIDYLDLTDESFGYLARNFPYLKYLSCIPDHKYLNQRLISARLLNLESLVFEDGYCPHFDDLEHIGYYCPKLSKFILTSRYDNFLDDQRWEDIFTRFMPKIESFHLIIKSIFKLPLDLSLNKFSSEYWVNKKCQIRDTSERQIDVKF